MLLSDRDLRVLIEQGNVYVPTENNPLDLDLQLGPSSIDLRLAPEVLLFDNHAMRIIDLSEKIPPRMRRVTIDDKDGFVLHPGEFVLGSTLEAVKVPTDMVALLEGRSSLGRLGLIIHATAGFVDPGFEGQITLEMQNIGNQPLLLRPYQRVCQLCFYQLSSHAETPYNKKKDTKYHGQFGPVASRLSQEVRKTPEN
jgi:dCTP deaminase